LFREAAAMGCADKGGKKSKNRGKPIGLCIRVGRKGEKRAKSDTLQHLDALGQAAASFLFVLFSTDVRPWSTFT